MFGKKIFLYIFAAFLFFGGVAWLLAQKPPPGQITYGSSFSVLYARELGLDWKKVYGAILDDLGVKHLRLAAYWSLTEPRKDVYSWSELDYQLAEARARNADVILGIGRRLPRWPECHVPEWAQSLEWESQKSEIKEYMTAVVSRYKNEPSIIYWQIENEPYLTVFARELCGELDEDFLKEEIALVRSLDNTRPILLTDSGNLGTWFGAYKNGDAFGTSVYVYLWNPEIGPLKTALPSALYRIKENLLRGLYGRKQTFLIELSLEPWLLEPVTNVSLDTQYSRMNLEKFNEVIDYARATRYDTQYLWGAEWWYWLRTHSNETLWNRARELFAQ